MSTIESNPITKDMLVDSSLFSEVNKKRIAIEKGENWGEFEFGTNKRYYDLYWGPVEKEDKDCVSDYIYIKDEWYEDILKQVGIFDYNINDSENHHTLYLPNDQEAKTKFKEIVKILKDLGFKVIRDCY